MKVLIIGGGLSGICLGHCLLENNIDFKIIDNNQNHSTKVAAGMINPITFRRMVKSWKADELIPFLQTFYSSVEKKINGKFFFPIQLRRVFSTEQEKALWIEKLEDAAFSSYINPPQSTTTAPNYFKNLYGTGVVNTPGYIDAKKFLQLNHHFFLSQKVLAYANFDFYGLEVEKKTYKNEKFTHFIFAEGFRGENNLFFNYLPFKNVKGEILTISSPAFRKEEILNRKCFILPTEDGNYKLGSTYSWNTTDPSPSKEGKEEILKKYHQLSNAPIKILKQEGGIRPVSADRRPLIGEHPQHKGIFIFNGMGAKGFMIAPYFSQHFIQTLLGKEKLEKEVDIQRFYKKYYLSKN